MMRYLFASIIISFWSTRASAEITVFDCKFPADKFAFLITVYDDGSPARIGREQGIGDHGKAYLDEDNGAWVVVEYNAGETPFTLTTILKDGAAWHSRHTLDVLGNIMPSQMAGKCSRKSIK